MTDAGSDPTGPSAASPNGAGPDDVVLRIAGSPENVRTARLVAAAVARREGLGEDRVDEVRIAVGEAVTWAMSASTAAPVRIVLGPGDLLAGEFVVRVAGGATVPAGPEDTDASDGLSLSLLRGLADRVQIDGDATVLTWTDVLPT